MSKPDYAPPAAPILVNDYLTSRKIAALSADGECLFNRMLLAQWQGGDLPDDLHKLMGFIGFRPGYEAAWPEVRALFEATADGLLNLKMEQVRERWAKISRARSNSGKTGREAQLAGKQQANDRANAGQISGKSPATAQANDRANAGPSASASASVLEFPAETPLTPRGGDGGRQPGREPPTLPKDLEALRARVIAANEKPERLERQDEFGCIPDAEPAEVYAYGVLLLRLKTQLNFEGSRAMWDRIRDGATQRDLTDLIRWYDQKCRDRPDFWTRFFDNDTPFLVKKWKRDLPKARDWVAYCKLEGRPMPADPDFLTPAQKERQRRANLGR